MSNQEIIDKSKNIGITAGASTPEYIINNVINAINLKGEIRMSRYKIWDKESDVITPIGEVLTPAQWIERYPVANVLPTVCGGGAINGAYFGIYDEMIDLYTKNGCDFSECNTEQEHLDKIEEFEDEMNAPVEVISAEERIASALEAQVLMSMPDEEV